MAKVKVIDTTNLGSYGSIEQVVAQINSCGIGTFDSFGLMRLNRIIDLMRDIKNTICPFQKVLVVLNPKSYYAKDTKLLNWTNPLILGVCDFLFG